MYGMLKNLLLTAVEVAAAEGGVGGGSGEGVGVRGGDVRQGADYAEGKMAKRLSGGASEGSNVVR